ncbi:hypothetical protein HDU82_006198 [Entophlyctis luteolus]|nr:hypothetical protein HDU82_006198 [Entophlyctis luteolus]
MSSFSKTSPIEIGIYPASSPTMQTVKRGSPPKAERVPIPSSSYASRQSYESRERTLSLYAEHEAGGVPAVHYLWNI